MKILASATVSKYPRDLLQRVMSHDMSHDKYEEEANEDKEEREIELNLGLSLGGRFGVDKTKLIRSSSIALTFPFFRDDSKNDESFAAAGLKRTASLPAETTEEEWRKKKELQTLRWLAAKRRRSEKQRSTTTANAAGNEKEEEEVGPSSAAAVIKAIPLWAAPKGKSVILGRSSSGLSELESKPFQGSSCGGEARGPASNHDQQTNHGTALCSLNSLTPEHASRISRAVMESMRKKPPIPSEDKGRDSQMNHMADMPCVFTKGDGPNGRKIDGILYRYAKGEEVRIMCVCHGTFLSPAEFVKHAGGGDVPNPLRHIVVNPAATSFL